MGLHKNINHKKFPKQSDWVGQRTEVCFNFNPDLRVGGTIVRDDLESPGETIIWLDDDRYVRATECQYSPPVGINRP